MHPPAQKIIVHLDMNSFFASVEQQADASLRGRALGVCSYVHEYGCVIATSIEAKRLGVNVGMTVKEARTKVPSMVFVETDPPKYRAITSKVFSLLHEISDRVEHYSIDEAFLDLTGWYRDAAEAAWAMTRIRERITKEVGDWLRCSIGIAPTRFLAKTASDMEKPNGLVIINQDNLEEKLSRLRVQDVCGIGPRMAKRLSRLGLTSLLEIKHYPVANLMHSFGKYGYFLWCNLNGIEIEQVHPAGESLPKSVGHSYCVPLRVNREGKVPSVLIKLTERAGRRMRSLGQLAGAVSVTVGFREAGFALPSGPFWTPLLGEGGTCTTRLGDLADDSFTLVSTATNLFSQLWSGQSVSFLAVTLSDLSVPTGQVRFMPDVRGDRRRSVSSAVDAIRDRYGDTSIMFGSMMTLTDEAPDRIGFRKTEGVDIPSCTEAKNMIAIEYE